MRPLRLDLQGFTVFRDLTTVDFTDADFFVLIGPTGAGKSTVLDAICFALYGTVPRWHDRRAVGNALAPSSAQARVRLIFECAGARYAATRVVRRDGKGRVATTHAGLELLPKGFNVADLDGTDPTAGQLGEPLAGTPGEMEQAVLDAVGLPYEQFTSCVLLPQGAFAEFLHAKPAQRQQILINLLGLSIYEDVQKRATALAAEADAQLAAGDRLLAELADASDAALADADRRLDAMRGLAAEVGLAVPTLVSAQRDAAQARTALIELDTELARLGQVRPDRDAGRVAAAVLAAREAGTAAGTATVAAEEREEKLRAELATAGDVPMLHRLLDEHAERDRTAAQAADFAVAVAQAEQEHAKASHAVDRATEAATRAAAGVAAAEHGVEQARTADRAATLRPHLRVGHACPVCTQPVAALPAMPAAPALGAAQAVLAQAQRAVESAGRVVTTQDRAARELDRTLTRVRTERDALGRRIVALDDRLADAPDPESARATLAAVAQLQRDLDEAGSAVRTGREAHRRAASALSRAEDRLRAAWQSFDAARDTVAPFGPPPADRDDLAAAWQELTGWAGEQIETRQARRDALAGDARTAAEATIAAAGRIAGLFTAAGLAPPAELSTLAQLADPAAAGRSGGPGRADRGGPVDAGAGAAAGAAAGQAAAIAVERAQAARTRLVERRGQADRLREQRAGHERDGQVAKTLANHLRANNFERWLLEEALDLLVDGASTILSELSSGQYELMHDKGEFFIIDQHDAGLRRPVRTLSGGETFQASLALALALSDRLAGMSTGAASLESIVLDEGFGTLDASTLDVVAATLENLAARGDRMVGVVTHVGALAERIPVRFEIRKDTRTAYVDRIG